MYTEDFWSISLAVKYVNTKSKGDEYLKKCNPVAARLINQVKDQSVGGGSKLLLNIVKYVHIFI